MRDDESSLIGAMFGGSIGKVAGLAAAVGISFLFDHTITKVYPDILEKTRILLDMAVSVGLALPLSKVGYELGSYIGGLGFKEGINQVYSDTISYFQAVSRKRDKEKIS